MTAFFVLSLRPQNLASVRRGLLGWLPQHPGVDYLRFKDFSMASIGNPVHTSASHSQNRQLCCHPPYRLCRVCRPAIFSFRRTASRRAGIPFMSAQEAVY